MLTAQDVQTRQFHVRFRGFDMEEVDEFLEQATGALQALSDENARLKGQLETAERQLTTCTSQEKSTLDAILSAQKIAEEMKDKAQQEADALLAESRREAEKLLAEARRESRELGESATREISELEQKVDQLKAMKSQVREELRLVLDSYLAHLERDQSATPAPGRQVPTGQPAAAAGPAAVAAAAAESERAQDHDDLYQRIELPDDLLSPAGNSSSTPPEPAVQSAAKAVAAAEAATTEEEQTLPDLDGDMIFTLEDPLDGDPEEDEGMTEPSIRLAADHDEEPAESPSRRT